MIGKDKRVYRALNYLKHSLISFFDVSGCALDFDCVLISKVLRVSYSDHDEFVSVFNVFRKYNEVKEEIENQLNTAIYFINNGNALLFKKNTANKSTIVRRTKQNISNRAVSGETK